MTQRPQEFLIPVLADVFRFDFNQGFCHPLIGLIDIFIDALALFTL